MFLESSLDKNAARKIATGTPDPHPPAEWKPIERNGDRDSS
jgi:hypothetical protein